MQASLHLLQQSSQEQGSHLEHHEQLLSSLKQSFDSLQTQLIVQRSRLEDIERRIDGLYATTESLSRHIGEVETRLSKKHSDDMQLIQGALAVLLLLLLMFIISHIHLHRKISSAPPRSQKRVS